MSENGLNEREGSHSGIKWWVVALEMGYRCGYAIIPEGHPWHGKDCKDDLGCGQIAVHGGITYSEDLNNEFVVGFDCAHFGDLRDFAIMSEDYKSTFRDFPGMSGAHSMTWGADDVQRECECMCEQIAEAGRVHQKEKELWNRRAPRFKPEETQAMEEAIRTLLDQARYYGPGTVQPGAKAATVLRKMLKEAN